MDVSTRKKGVLKSACFLTSFLKLYNLVGNLFLEPDLQEVRLYFVACSIRWFVWELFYGEKGVLESACFCCVVLNFV